MVKYIWHGLCARVVLTNLGVCKQHHGRLEVDKSLLLIAVCVPNRNGQVCTYPTGALWKIQDTMH